MKLCLHYSLEQLFFSAFFKTRNGGTWSNRTQNTSGTVGKQQKTPEHQQNTPEYQWNDNATPAEHPVITKQYKMKNCSVYKENLNLTLIHLALSSQD